MKYIYTLWLTATLSLTLACSTLALQAAQAGKGVYLPPALGFTPAYIKALDACQKPHSARYGSLDGVMVEVDNLMPALGLTISPDVIKIRTLDANNKPLSIGTITGILLHEEMHISSYRRGNGPDTLHTQWASGELETIEDKIVLCALQRGE